MKVTQDVIIDLLPLYYEKEASPDTIKLVETYLNEHPKFAEELAASKELNIDIPLTMENDLTALTQTKKLLKLRSFLFGFAIFFSAIPFSFGDVSWSEIEGPHWLWINFPEGAIACGVVGIILWISYYRLQRRLEETGL